VLRGIGIVRLIHPKPGIRGASVRAIVQRAYGSPDLLRLADVAEPTAEDDSVLVHVRAASVNALDWRKVRADPFVVRLESGLLRPRHPLLGVDTAGHVERIGRNVEHLRPGDEVFGIGKGAFAELTSGSTFAVKPRNLSFEEAAAVPACGLTALQTVRDIAKVEAGERVLINGAGGGVGTFLVQVAKAFGAHVAAATRTANVDMIRGLGADAVIDHTREDFAARGERYDVIVEVGGTRSYRTCRNALAPGGRIVMVGAGSGLGGPIGRFIGAQVRSRMLSQPVTAFVSWESIDDLGTIRDLIEAGKVRPVIDRIVPIEDVPEAIRYVEEGRARGKVVISIG
jgi:NADPH:quinone reductase-like Zn-dependent oxidoreductase